MYKRIRAVVGALVAAVAVLSTPPATAQKIPLELKDLGRIAYPEHPSISPSGDSVALVIYRANFEDNRWDASLVLIDLESGVQKDLAPSRPDIEDPLWSPSGDRLAFLDDDEDGTTQIYVLPVDGGEARRLTEEDEDIRFYRWSPDGRSIVFARREKAIERERPERHNRSFEVGPSSYLTQSAPRPVHLWRVPVDGGKSVRLTEGADNVAGFEWSSEGDALVLEVEPSAHSAAFLRNSLQLLDLTSGVRRTLVPEGTFLFDARFSPDDRLISFHSPRGDEADFAPYGIFVLPRTGGAPRDVTAGLDRSLGSMTWLPDGNGMLVKGPDRTTVGVWLQPMSGPARRLDLGSVQPLSDLFASEAGRIAFIGTEPSRPPELYVMDGPEWTPERVTDFNGWIENRALGKVERVTWPGPDGFELTGVLFYPPDFQEGRRYPLVLHIHGGPMYTSIEGFSPLYQPFAGLDQLLAAQGWLVFRPNYRGSNNQEAAFQRAIINDAGDGPARDIMSGVELLKGRGIVDASRIAVSGWSYGGFLSTWLTAHYNGWTAAVIGAAPTAWLDDYAASDLNTWTGHGLGGSPWLDGNLENYRRQSVITYAHQIQTPTLILSTTGDERVPVIGSYKLYHALRDRGVEVKFVAYPVSGHLPSDPVHKLDVFRRWIDWIAYHFAEAESP